MKYLSGAKIDDGAPFSRDQVSTLVADYYQSVNALSTRRWQLIMDKVRAKNLDDVPVPLSASTMESNRHQLFIPSSPYVICFFSVSYTNPCFSQVIDPFHSPGVLPHIFV